MSSDSKNPLANISIEQEIRGSYLSYAMSVIKSRALPDARDGLKPVHRRILYSMADMGNYHNRGYKKSARIVGDVIGKYHPHGENAIYDSLVRMAQPFSMRYTLVNGQGNFGSIDGDPPAAMRYTEVKLERISEILLGDLDKDTVDFVDNYDGTESMPSVLPSRIPNLLVNGSSGIAVGMATNIPPHNLGEVLRAVLHRMENPECTLDDLMQFIPAPDFPTSGIIYGTGSLRQAYQTGRGRVVIRSRYHIEPLKHDRESIIVTEIPYQVNKSRLIEKIVELIKDKRVEGISEIRDESSKEGIRVVMELKRGENAEVLVNHLFVHTPLQTSFGINMVAIDNDQPKQLSLIALLDIFIAHRREVVSRRSLYELNKNKAHTHLLEGLTVAMSNVDLIIALIRSAPDTASAKKELLGRTWDSGEVAPMVRLVAAQEFSEHTRIQVEGCGLLEDGTYKLSEAQAQAILELRLHRLTSLEQSKLWKDYSTQLESIKSLLMILTEPDQLESLIKEELNAVLEKFADSRKSTIEHNTDEMSTLDLIAEEEMVVTLSQDGYIKAQPTDSFRTQNRGGRGKVGAELKETDRIKDLLVTSNHNTLLCFTSLGRVFSLPVYKVPVALRTARGRPLINMLQLQEGESVAQILALNHEDLEDAKESSESLVFATVGGTVKRSLLSSFAKIRKSGLIAINLAEGDELIGVSLVPNEAEVMLFSSGGQATRFLVANVRIMGRTATGVRGMRLAPKARVVRMLVVKKEDESTILVVCQNGFGKRSKLSEFPIINRGGKGVIAIKTSSRNGALVTAEYIFDEKEMMLISKRGILVRISLSSVPILSRSTQGVRLLRLDKDDVLKDLALLKPEEGEQGELPVE